MEQSQQKKLKFIKFITVPICLTLNKSNKNNKLVGSWSALIGEQPAYSGFPLTSHAVVVGDGYDVTIPTVYRQARHLAVIINGRLALRLLNIC